MTIVAFSSDAFRVDGENAAKTIVWTNAVLVKTERFENGAKRKRISVERALFYRCKHREPPSWNI